MRKGNPKGPWRVEGVLVVKTLPEDWPSLTGLAVIVPVPLPQPLSTPKADKSPNLLPSADSGLTSLMEPLSIICVILLRGKGRIKITFLPRPMRLYGLAHSPSLLHP